MAVQIVETSARHDQKTRVRAFGAALSAGGLIGLHIQPEVPAIGLLEPGLFALGVDLIQDC